MEELNIIETFVGAGGGNIGFKNNGFKPLLLNDINKNMIETLKLNNNYTDDIYYCGTINNINIENFPNLYNKNINVLLGGIVCKGFSLSGNRNPVDERNYLYLEQLRLVKELNPQISIIENVPQLKTMYIIDKNRCNIENIYKLNDLYMIKKQLNGKKTNKKNNLEDLNKEIIENKNEIKKLELELNNFKYKVFDEILKIYDELNYKVFFKILNCADYGDYTTRKRLFIIAIRNDIHEKNGDFEFPTNLFNKENYKTAEQCFLQIDYNIDDKHNKSMKHSEKTIENFKKIPMGKSIKDVDNTTSFFSRGTTKRIHKDLPVPTLVPGHSAFPIHYKEDRSLTLREGACLTGFPVDYKFFGSHTSICEQIGNAIPINTATQLALFIKNYLKK